MVGRGPDALAQGAPAGDLGAGQPDILQHALVEADEIGLRALLAVGPGQRGSAPAPGPAESPDERAFPEAGVGQASTRGSSAANSKPARWMLVSCRMAQALLLIELDGGSMLTALGNSDEFLCRSVRRFCGAMSRRGRLGLTRDRGGAFDDPGVPFSLAFCRPTRFAGLSPEGLTNIAEIRSSSGA